MKPDAERIARELAYVVLADDGHHPSGSTPGVGEVIIEMRGMVQTIRRHLLIGHARIALKIADEIQRQTEDANLDTMIAEAVKRESANLRERIGEIVRREMAAAVEVAVRRAVEVAARAIGEEAASKIIKAAR